MDWAHFWIKAECPNRFIKLNYHRVCATLRLRRKIDMNVSPCPSKEDTKPSPTRSARSTSQSRNASQTTEGKKATRMWSVWGEKTNGNGQQQPAIARFTSSQSSLKSEGAAGGCEQTLEDEFTIATDSRKRLETSQEEQEPRKSWRFWSRTSSTDSSGQQDGDQTGITPKVAASLTNVWIPSTDTIIHKTADTKRDPKNKDDTPSEPNIVVPSFDILPHQTIYNSLKSYAMTIARRWNIIVGSSAQKHLYQQGPHSKLKQLSENGRRPIKVLVVGVHGFFPTKMIRPFIGEPTGTSLKFVAEAEKVIRKYFREYNQQVEISKIALEREGEIFERVNFFFDVMKNWSKEINQSDFIYFVCHSQGSPVTILLLADLIDAGLINLDNTRFFNEGEVPFSTNKKIISILAMAGINNGPFYGADQTLFVRAYQTIEKESLRELFQFQRPDSLVSQKLIRSMRIIIGSNVKISFVGSINDQLVPLYSSMCLFASHPNLFRATFIDRSSRTPAFLIRLINIAGTLLNLGYDEHGIVKEISPSLAGSLTGGGHSSIYSEAQVYELGLRFALETTDVTANMPVRYKPYQLEKLCSNPYHLPWCMRGLIYEIDHHLDPNEVSQLFKEFENWEPETKSLKDVKYRLTGLKNKL